VVREVRYCVGILYIYHRLASSSVFRERKCHRREFSVVLQIIIMATTTAAAPSATDLPQEATRRLQAKKQTLDDAYAIPANFLEIDVVNPITHGIARTRYTDYEVRMRVSKQQTGKHLPLVLVSCMCHFLLYIINNNYPLGTCLPQVRWSLNQLFIHIKDTHSVVLCHTVKPPHFQA